MTLLPRLVKKTMRMFIRVCGAMEVSYMGRLALCWHRSIPQSRSYPLSYKMAYRA